MREKGMFSFYEDGHGECCRVRKVRAERGSAAAWMGTKQQREQRAGGAVWGPGQSWQGGRPTQGSGLSGGRAETMGTLWRNRRVLRHEIGAARALNRSVAHLGLARLAVAGAAAAQAADRPQGLDHRPAQGPVARHPHGGAHCAGGEGVGVGEVMPPWLAQPGQKALHLLWAPLGCRQYGPPTHPPPPFFPRSTPCSRACPAAPAP